MKHLNFETLSEAMNNLTQRGYTDNFVANDTCIKALYAKKEYQPSDLTIDETYRFEGITNPSDQSELFAISTKDGIKGTLSMSYGANHSQNTELIKQIK
ncbi:phosphoribosylpyrophosphate synthetase [Wenyingzhuangia fucanilytica]|uniref:Phosphoribosylpyrophosphate synthetase n=1 Tax=Wenyingzhuangia fucanilytica TaxID=1790137 RepID=A0A1B1Y6F3_9FLAO|nr:phosphoribosylpyrophosphate synthetase [Wenyingzhuangia fucanilytica]ANW96345.1 phosphoribosylpyrophosphate synthetase [Wenyingzhuangia fucanilytica]